MKRREILKAGLVAAASAALPSTAGAMRQRGGMQQERQRRNATDKREFDEESKRIYERHFAQTRETVAALKRKYEKPILGRVKVSDQLDKLALCIDASDTSLACTNQLIHVQQVLEGMERDGIQDRDLYLAALTHDLGKVLLLAGESQENVVCANTPIGEYAQGAGLDHVVFQWNHDEFIFSRLKDHLPDHVAWLIHYHSIDIDKATPYMDERDRRYTEKYLAPFRTYDLGTKSIWRVPSPIILDKYRALLDEVLPAPVLI